MCHSFLLHLTVEKNFPCTIIVVLSGLYFIVLKTIQNITVDDENHQSHYRPEVPRGFQEVKVPRLHDNGPEWW